MMLRDGEQHDFDLFFNLEKLLDMAENHPEIYENCPSNVTP